MRTQHVVPVGHVGVGPQAVAMTAAKGERGQSAFAAHVDNAVKSAGAPIAASSGPAAPGPDTAVKAPTDKRPSPDRPRPVMTGQPDTVNDPGAAAVLQHVAQQQTAPPTQTAGTALSKASDKTKADDDASEAALPADAARAIPINDNAAIPPLPVASPPVASLPDTPLPVPAGTGTSEAGPAAALEAAAGTGLAGAGRAGTTPTTAGALPHDRRTAPTKEGVTTPDSVTSGPGVDRPAEASPAPTMQTSQAETGTAATTGNVTLAATETLVPHHGAGSRTAGAAAAQTGTALMALTTTPDGASRMTVQLMPRDLGKVEVAIVRDADGTAHVSVTADQPQTLRSLMSDADHLHGLLDQAGVPSEGRTMQFDLAPPATADAGSGGTGGQPSRDDPTPSSQAAPQSGFDLGGGSQNGNGPGGGGPSGGGQGGGGQTQAWRIPAPGGVGLGTDVAAPGATLVSSATTRSWGSAGLNITA